jgi:hypothetical protein
MGLLHRFLDHRTPDAWSRLESPLGDLRGVPIKQMAGL